MKIEIQVTMDNLADWVTLDTLIQTYIGADLTDMRDKITKAVQQKIREVDQEEFGQACDRVKQKLESI